jgi:hypothetical protein
MKTHSTKWFGLIPVLALLAACGGSSDDETTSAARSYFATQSPGDAWIWNINPPTFDAANVSQAQPLTYRGSAELFDSGFLKLIVPDAVHTNDSSITAFPFVAYAVELPQTVLLVKPVGSNSDVIFGVALGNCPTAVASYNWITMPKQGWDSDLHEAYGTATVTPGATLSFSVQSYRLDGTSLGTSTQTASCDSGGQLTFSDGSKGSIAPTGTIVVDKGDQGGVIGMLVPGANIDLVDAASKSYLGVNFQRQASGERTTEAVWGEPGSGADVGKLVGACFDNLETGARCGVPPHGAVFDIPTASQPNPGMARVGMTDNYAGLRPSVMMANKVNNKYFLVGISTSGNGTHAHLEPNLFLVVEK